MALSRTSEVTCGVGQDSIAEKYQTEHLDISYHNFVPVSGSTRGRLKGKRARNDDGRVVKRTHGVWGQ